MDFHTYLDATRSWLGGGAFYPPAQVAGPYTVTTGAVLYPPVALLLFVPFAFLPAALWWAVPTGITLAALWRYRPGPWTLALITGCLALHGGVLLYWFGTPTIWFVAFVALVTIHSWPGVLIALKPAILPFALLGIRDRRWWIAAGVLALISLPLLPMWVDWLRTLLNARGPRASLLYAVWDIPLLVVPLLAWARRSTLLDRAPRLPGIMRQPRPIR
jgi:hypothetical protein